MTQSYGRILFVLAGIALAIYFAFKVAQRVDAYFFPWADERSGRPLLTGMWVGTSAPPAATPLALLLEIHRWRDDAKKPCPDCRIIEGSIRSCDAEGTVVTYRVSGVPLARNAKHINLRAMAAPNQGLIDHEFAILTGEWQGNELRVEIKEKREHTPVRGIMMVRSGEAAWRSECDELAARASLK